MKLSSDFKLVLSVSTFIVNIAARNATISALLGLDSWGTVQIKFTSDYKFLSNGIRFSNPDTYFYNDTTLGYEVYEVISLGSRFISNSFSGYALIISRFNTSF